MRQLPTAPPAPEAAPPATPPARSLSPALAVVLEAMLPGAGALYARRVGVALTWFLATIFGSLAGLLGVALLPTREYRISFLGVLALAALAWLVIRCLNALTFAQERNAALAGPLDDAAPATPPQAPGLARAHGLLWLAIFLEMVTVVIGIPADRAWHITHVFDGFFSPPHDFIYASVLLTVLVMVYMTFAPRVRVWFGPAFRMPFFPFPVPGALVLAGGGLVTTGIAGLLDSIWHTAFGLDETGWSTPHAMLGWGFLMTFLGFVACRLALRPYRPLRWYTVAFFGFLLIGFTATPFMGPLHDNTTPERLRAVATLPILLAQAAALHTYRIYLTWNLTRTNPIFLPLTALWAGAALALIRRLDRRVWLFLGVITLWTLLTLLGQHNDARSFQKYFALTDFATNPANWLPLPLLPAAVVYLLARLARVPARWAWLPAGLVYGVVVVAIWGPYRPLGLPLILLAAPIVLVGALLGNWIWGVLDHPTHGRAWALLLIGVCAPLVTGIVDLYLRVNTP